MELNSGFVIGRRDNRTQKYGELASLLLGKTIDKDNNVFFDISKPHVALICGKRGLGKSYTQSNIIEGIAIQPDEIRKEISVIIFDTMGIFWSLKYPNNDKKELDLLEKWGLSPKSVNIQIFVPRNKKEDYLLHDKTFSFIPGEITAENWCLTFGLDQNSPLGICITRAIQNLKKEFSNYTLDDLINEIKKDKRSATQTKDALENRFEGAKEWGIFGSEGTSLKELLAPGIINVIDISQLYYSAETWNIRSLVVSLLAEKILAEKMKARQKMQLSEIEGKEVSSEISSQVWILIDEAHQFLPSGTLTPASWPLKRMIREGRQPGISLVLATQQPGKLDTDVITQSDIVITHHISSQVDIDGLNKIMNIYQKKSIKFSLEQLPKRPGAALVIDDTRETIEMIQVRPKMTMHAGESPDILRKIFGVLE